SLACLAVIRYCRFERKATLMETVEPGCDLHQVENVEQAARQAARLGNNIFLTIGSRGLGDFIRNLPESGLTVTARVLPDLKVMEKCLEMGLQPRNIIAMQGPFSHELNLAMLRDCGAKVLVTKDSGREGGAAAKFSAAGELRIPVVVIDRPKIEYSNMFSDFNGVLEFIKG
ncbi:MAG TPA: precorrin-6A/cobalt-precorrin-6A reductase, partial [Bacillota bacterium]|nr:precorrin-6A/cobalt-precorrin-6A reductase [Bacillota bacterium]